jgi:D-glycero-alpha-D-manno-heptose-7-phosphate kinase
MFVRARAPLRLGLGGGGTDVSPYCDQYGGFVLNATIARYAYAMVEASPGDMIQFTASDQGQSARYKLVDQIPFDGTLDLHKGIYNRIVRQFNGGRPIGLKLTTFNEAPPGSGLGGSSTLVVAALRALSEWLSLPLGDYDLAHLAYEIERKDVGLQGGRQDQYAATFGGFNFMEFYENDRVIVNPLRIKNWVLSELEASLILFYTGVSRESAHIIAEQSDNIASRSESALAAMHELREDAVAMKEALLLGRLETFAHRLERSWLAKKRTASRVSNSLIDTLCEGVKAAGATAAKASGAGGGGFLIIFADPLHRFRVLEYLGSQQGVAFGCNFTKAGTQAWRVG